MLQSLFSKNHFLVSMEKLDFKFEGILDQTKFFVWDVFFLSNLNVKSEVLEMNQKWMLSSQPLNVFEESLLAEVSNEIKFCWGHFLISQIRLQIALIH